eukprot:210012_1
MSINIVYDKYDVTQVLNDYHHLLIHHPFEYVKSYLNRQKHNAMTCELISCYVMKRNQRNRFELGTKHSDIRQMYFNCESDEDIVRQQTLDVIHCHYAHSFDIGYKITKTQLQNIMSEFKSDDDSMQIVNDINVYNIHKMLQQKKRSYTNVRGLNRLMNPINKFMVPNSKDSIMSEFSYGYRYFYWSYYKDSTAIHDPVFPEFEKDVIIPESNKETQLKDWYIPMKYDSIKEELTNNEVCKIGMIQMNNLVEKSLVLCKHILIQVDTSWIDRVGKYYDMDKDILINIAHIIAMMAYCNYDLLSAKFSETYRVTVEHPTENEMKLKHTNYHWMGRLLREIVECFGMSTSNEWVLFHGVSQQFIFPSLDAHIKGPLSTTTQFTVAGQFCNNKGMILELIPQDGRCFDCAGITDFTAENEIFFIGGISKFRFASIIQAAIGMNYQVYVEGIRSVSYGMSTGGRQLEEFHWKTLTRANMDEKCYDPLDPNHIPPVSWKYVQNSHHKQMVFRLLSHQMYKIYPNHPLAHQFKGCPKYIDNLLDQHCKSIKYISIYVDDPPSRLSSDIHSAFFKYDNNWLKLDALTNMFVNVEQIYYEPTDFGDLTLFTNQLMYESTLQFLRQNSSTKLVQIICTIDPSIGNQISKYINTYAQSFKRQKWEMMIRKQDSKLISNVWKLQKCDLLVMKHIEQEIKTQRYLAQQSHFC